MGINRNKPVQRLPLHISFRSPPPFILPFHLKRFISILWFSQTKKWISTVHSSLFVCTRCYRYYLFVEYDRFLLGKFLQSDWKECFRMRPAVTLHAHGGVSHAITKISFFRSRSLYYLLLFFHSCSMPFVFSDFFRFLPFLFWISDCMFFTVASQHLPVFCRFHLIFRTSSALPSLRLRCTMIYCTSERRANSYLIKKIVKQKNMLMVLWFHKKNEQNCISISLDSLGSFFFISCCFTRIHAEMKVWCKRCLLDKKNSSMHYKPDTWKCIWKMR